MKQYISLEDKPGRETTHIRVSVYYSKDQHPRGYALSVRPVKIKDGWETCLLFSGCSKFLKEVKRYSKKVEEQVCLEVLKELSDKTGNTWEMVEMVTQEAT
jgi:hypothetical protein